VSTLLHVLLLLLLLLLLLHMHRRPELRRAHASHPHGRMAAAHRPLVEHARGAEIRVHAAAGVVEHDAVGHAGADEQGLSARDGG
jgi:hypothetical protein